MAKPNLHPPAQAGSVPNRSAEVSAELSRGDVQGHRAWARRMAPIGPRSITALLDVSNKCNLRCRMCHFAFDSVFHRPARYMKPEVFSDVAAQLLPLAHTAYLSAGSESMTSPHFAEILRIAGQYDVPDLKFLTNGLLMDADMVEAILAAGVNQIHFSVDGATKGTYEYIRVGGNFELLVRNIEHLSRRKRELGRERPLLQFNITLMRSNLDELEEFVGLAERIGVERISARHLMPYDGLDVAAESLALDKVYANRRLRAFLDRVAASETVTLANFPDAFSVPDEDDSTPEYSTLDGAAPVRTNGSTPPLVGSMDTPVAPSFPGAELIRLSGWALDGLGGVEVHIGRVPTPSDRDSQWLDPKTKRSLHDLDTNPQRDSLGLVPLGKARFARGMRPDIASLHRHYPLRHRNAWAFELKREELADLGPVDVTVVAVAHAPDGRWLEIGRRVVRYGDEAEFHPHAFCTKPFDNVYVDSEANVYPYPDCQTVAPYGRVDPERSFREIWYGKEFMELRKRILDRDPPRMCLTCPDLINRNVDGAEFFAEREVEGPFRAPRGFVEGPVFGTIDLFDSAVFSGWAVGFEEFEGVQLCLRSDDDVTRSIGWAEFTSLDRPDVMREYHRYDRREQPTWRARVHRADFPDGHGQHEVLVVGRNRDGSSTILGHRTVRVAPRGPEPVTIPGEALEPKEQHACIELVAVRGDWVRVAGWALTVGGPPAEVRVGGHVARPWRRGDVRDANPSIPDAERAGFSARLPRDDLRDGIVRITIGTCAYQARVGKRTIWKSSRRLVNGETIALGG